MHLLRRMKHYLLAIGALTAPASALAHDVGGPHMHPHGAVTFEQLLLVGLVIAVLIFLFLMKSDGRAG